MRALLGVLLLCVVLPRLALAAGCPVPPGAASALASRDSAERIHFLRAKLQAESGRAGAWLELWDVSLAALAVVPVALVPVAPDQGYATDLLFGAATSAATVVMITALPPPALAHQSSIAPRPGGPPEDSCEEVARLEALFSQVAQAEAAGQGVRAHLMNVVVNVGVAMLGLGVGLGRWQSAILGSISGTALGELMLLTQPRYLMDDLGRYRAGELGASGQLSGRWGLSAQWRPDGFGLRWSIAF